MRNLTGVIVALLSSKYGYVELDKPYRGRDAVVVDSRTKGRLALMRRLGGKLTLGAPVVVKKLRFEKDCMLLATQIE